MTSHITCSKCGNRMEITDRLNADLRLLSDSQAVEIKRLREKLDRMDGYVADLQRLVKAMPLEYPLRLLPPGMCAIIGNMHSETREAADAAGGGNER